MIAKWVWRGVSAIFGAALALAGIYFVKGALAPDRGLQFAEFFTERCFSRLAGQRSVDLGGLVVVPGSGREYYFDEASKFSIQVSERNCLATDVFAHLSDGERNSAIGEATDAFREAVPTAVADDRVEQANWDIFVVFGPPWLDRRRPRPLPVFVASRWALGDDSDPTVGSLTFSLDVELDG